MDWWRWSSLHIFIQELKVIKFVVSFPLWLPKFSWMLKFSWKKGKDHSKWHVGGFSWEGLKLKLLLIGWETIKKPYLTASEIENVVIWLCAQEKRKWILLNTIFLPCIEGPTFYYIISGYSLNLKIMGVFYLCMEIIIKMTWKMLLMCFFALNFEFILWF